MVTPPASTGMMVMSKIAVIRKPCANSGILNSVMPGARMFRMVTITLIEPRIEDTPSMCTAKIAKSMPQPLCTDSGAYMVQPVSTAPGPTPARPRKNGSTSMMAAGGRIQKPQLFSRGSAMSGAPSTMGSM